MVAQVDRKARDKKFARFVVIKSGEHKGLKAKTLFADDNIVRVEIVANAMKLVLPRDQVMAIDDPTKPIGYTNSQVSGKSFDDAAQRDMGADILEGFGVAGGRPGQWNRDPYRPSGKLGMERSSSYFRGPIDHRITRAEDEDIDPVMLNGGSDKEDDGCF